MQTISALIRSALPFPLALSVVGCAAVVGVDEFSVESSSSTGSFVDPCTKVHGCSRADADDFTGTDSDTMYISFSKTSYNPRCVRVRNGAKVNFNSDDGMLTFGAVPIAGGTSPEPDLDSPIQNPTDSSAVQATFELTAVQCVYPYFSPPSAETMNGAIFIGGK